MDRFVDGYVYKTNAERIAQVHYQLNFTVDCQDLASADGRNTGSLLNKQWSCFSIQLV